MLAVRPNNPLNKTSPTWVESLLGTARYGDPLWWVARTIQDKAYRIKYPKASMAEVWAQPDNSTTINRAKNVQPLLTSYGGLVAKAITGGSKTAQPALPSPQVKAIANEMAVTQKSASSKPKVKTKPKQAPKEPKQAPKAPAKPKKLKAKQGNPGGTVLRAPKGLSGNRGFDMHCVILTKGTPNTVFC